MLPWAAATVLPQRQHRIRVRRGTCRFLVAGARAVRVRDFRSDTCQNLLVDSQGRTVVEGGLTKAVLVEEVA